jgi:hypothetical protein
MIVPCVWLGFAVQDTSTPFSVFVIHKGVRHAQQRAGERRQRGQHKQLIGRKLKAHFVEVNGNYRLAA